MTQYEVGDPHWRGDVQYLQTVPMVTLLVRGINAFNIVKQLIAHKSQVRATELKSYFFLVYLFELLHSRFN